MRTGRQRSISRIGIVSLLFTIILFSSYCGYAQIEATTGIDMSYPLLINKNNNRINYSQISFGLRFGISYKPPQTQFFPTLDFSFGRTRLPLKQFEVNDVDLNFNYLNLMLNGNYVISLGENDNSLYMIGGIGFADLNQKGLYIAGKNGQAMNASIDSTANINKIFPAIGLGMEYVYGASVNRNLYLSLGLYFQYIYLLPENNSYYVTVRDFQGKYLSLNANLEGHPIIPTFYISIHYLLGKNLIFWHKKNSMYL